MVEKRRRVTRCGIVLIDSSSLGAELPEDGFFYTDEQIQLGKYTENFLSLLGELFKK